MAITSDRDLVVGVGVGDEPNPRLVAAVARGGGLGVLNLTGEPERLRRALADAARWAPAGFAVRVRPTCPVGPAHLPAQAHTVLIDVRDLPHLPDWAPVRSGLRTLAEIVCPEEAAQAAAAGVAGLVARGHEAGGRVGQLTSFVLLQHLLAAGPAGRGAGALPVWLAGGIGPHTAAAAVAGGAAGVLLDTHLALVAEAELPQRVTAAIRAMDGTETVVIDGYRVYTRPDLPVADLAAGPGGPGAVLGVRDLHRQLLPVGQDAPSAAALAGRYRSATGVVAAVRRAVRDQLAVAVAQPALAPGNGLAGDGRLRYPVVQGPMTRVSDQARFAAAVADAGGLPFLALALMSGEQTRRLLAETAAQLGDRPWGVGLLGFAPAELRAAQMSAVREVRPPYALIAGGRPDQAAPLEAAGTATFLHAPSPGLLDQYLAQGARRFVLEGAECGGHVGPRTSFALWDIAVQRLLAYGDRLDDVQVLFAGGIHDERSAAMVAALAAPLAARGAAIGVLMGTAYLFTTEAVAAGAIVPDFQRAAVECTETVLLETSPGHATRCARTEYVTAFSLTRQRLAEAGTPVQDAWAELERLNLGRLRVASKGLRREGDSLVPVDAATQRRDGMYMLGQVAALRSETTTVARLHRQVTEDTAALLGDRLVQLGPVPSGPSGPPVMTERTPLDVAIVGMSCILPQAADLAEYWSNVVGGVDAVTEVPAERWNAGIYFDPEAYARDRRDATPSKWGGFLPRVPFDPLSYGIPPASLPSIEPVQLLSLEVAARALADAGYAERPFDRDRTSVIFGAEAGHDLATAYGFRALLPGHLGPLPPELDRHLPRLTEDSFPGVLTNVIAGRIANRLDLGGVNYTVDAACAASLAALDLACKELRTNSSDMVLCGAADLHNGIYDYLMFASVRALSPRGRCATFAADADGIALGEGVACVVLKRLADAERDGDRVYAVVKAVAGSSDGRSLGLTAPRPEGQRRATERAYQAAGVSPAEVGMIEAHGTGTVVGDRTELATLTELFTAAGAAPGSCALGSVKSQLGHTKCAAGLAGLIKAARAVYTGVRPPTLHLGAPNPYWDVARSPFVFDTAARPWLAPPDERVAGVSAFGFGGTNFHTVLAGYGGAGEPAQALDQWPAELFLVRGADRADAVRRLDRLTGLVAANDGAGRPWRLRDLAFTLATGALGAAHAPVQVAFVARDLAELAEKLVTARQFRTDLRSGLFVAPESEDGAAGTVAFLFPGQGSQRPGAMADLFVAFPRLRELLVGSAARYADAMFPPAAFDPDTERARQRTLADTRVAQPALGVLGLAAHQVLGTLGVRPDLVAGHSYGELVALCVAGVFGPETLVRLSDARAEAILAAAGDDPGTMAAVAAAPDRVRQALAGHPGVVVANHNAPTQTVISGPTAAVDAALGELARQRLTARPLPVACAFHSPVVAAAADAFEAVLADLELSPPGMPVWGNSDAAPYPADPPAVRRTLARQLAAPVRFVEQIEAMYASGARVFVEAGPGAVLTGLVGAALGDRPHTAVALDRPGRPGLPTLLAALAELAVTGVPVDPEPLFTGRDAAVVTAAEVPPRPGWTVDGHLVRTADGEPVHGGLRPAAVVATPSTAPAVPVDPRPDAAVLEFLRSSRELIAAQRDVVLGYLGAGSRPPAAGTVGTDGLGVPAADASVDEPDGTARTSRPPRGTDAADGTPMPGSVRDLVIATVSARTGYPPDMLDPGLDLEADLSIDSIKRTELIGELADRLGFAGRGGRLGDGVIEELARIKTIDGIVSWIDARTGATAPVDAVPVDVSAPDAGAAARSTSAGTGTPGPVWVEPPRSPADGDTGRAGPGAPTPLRRFTVAVTPVSRPPAAAPGALAGSTFAIVGDGCGVGLELTDLLEERGARVLLRMSDERAEGIDGLVYLGALGGGQQPVLPAAFPTLRSAVLGGVRRLLVVTGSAGTFGQDWDGEPATDPAAGAGLRGLVRTIAQEFPDRLARVVDVDPKQTPRAIARDLLAELGTAESPVTVGYTSGARTALRVVERQLPRETVREGGSTDLSAACRAAGLGPESVVLLTGGARGITATVAVALAEAAGCHIVLAGRTAPPAGPPDTEAMAAADEPALRGLLAARGLRGPAEVALAARRLAAERQVRDTLDRLAGTAASVRYVGLDVRDRAAVRQLVSEVRDRHGRLDAIVHGAGVCADRLLADKTPESFAEVYATKVDGARALADAAPPGLRYLLLFGSVSGVFGNRGQVDYAAANDALDTLARAWHGRVAERVLSVDWGPWSPAGGGMVTPELAREYDRRGIGLIDPAEGVAALVAELAWGPADQCQVGFVAAPLSAFDPGAAW
ncbi:SDR family NAD(P)-dependent oxidoreductase [Micromonospora sp. URMC 105]|uniref:SDR family NAD(P)-dependent oxidoreductase n=1 Tax=Micromonospora sp. URMC 105 TaxID=3423413 RepID=UPI003F19A681